MTPSPHILGDRVYSYQNTTEEPAHSNKGQPSPDQTRQRRKGIKQD